MGEKDKGIRTVFSSTDTRQMHNIYITGPIGPPENYTDALNTIRTAQKGDFISMYINSGGGYFWTAMQFVSAMNNCDCEIEAYIDGEAHSAASIIFLAADSWVVPDFASMLCHNLSTGTYGKGHEVDQWHKYHTSHYKQVVGDLYKTFLTSTEITELIGGKDFWLSGKDIITRLDKLTKAQEKDMKKKEKEMKSQIIENLNR